MACARAIQIWASCQKNNRDTEKYAESEKGYVRDGT